jgi:dUTP pyrophosphatase
MEFQMKVKVMKVDEYSAVKVPTYGSIGAAGFDLVNGTDRSWVIPPGGRTTIGCGLMFEIPEGYELQIRPRSGLAFNFGVLTSFGTIDSDYRGEVKLNMMNFSRVDYCVPQGARIAQAVLAPIVRAEFEMVNELSKTERGKKGFGSSGY